MSVNVRVCLTLNEGETRSRLALSLASANAPTNHSAEQTRTKGTEIDMYFITKRNRVVCVRRG